MAVNKFQDGKIYKISSMSRPDLVYYGSTTQTLDIRFNQHVSDNLASKEIIKLGDAYIELVEDYPCKSKKKLIARESYYINSNICVNIHMNKKYVNSKVFEYHKNQDLIIEKKWSLVV